jgi:hypothetical protein
VAHRCPEGPSLESMQCDADHRQRSTCVVEAYDYIQSRAQALGQAQRTSVLETQARAVLVHMERLPSTGRVPVLVLALCPLSSVLCALCSVLCALCYLLHDTMHVLILVPVQSRHSRHRVNSTDEGEIKGEISGPTASSETKVQFAAISRPDSALVSLPNHAGPRVAAYPARARGLGAVGGLALTHHTIKARQVGRPSTSFLFLPHLGARAVRVSVRIRPRSRFC